MLPRTAAALTVATVLCAGLGGVARADDDGTLPTRDEVREARTAVAAGARDVAAVRADLAAARDRVVAAQIAAAKAAEAFNGARYAAGLARDEATAARAAEAEAGALADQLRDVLRRATLGSYTTSSDLAVANALLDADGVSGLLAQLGTAQVGAQALGSRDDELTAAEDRAAAASERAASAEAEARVAADRARSTRDAARDAVHAAVAEERSAEARRVQLTAELAALEGVSVRLAHQREQGLARRAAARAAALAARRREQAAAAAQAAAEAAAVAAAQQEAQQQAAAAETPDVPDGQATDPAPDADPDPAPDPAPTPAPAAGGDVAAAVAFARAQLGEPYRWAAAGPDAWDCSGLTMGAWAAAGISLPHYSVAQYEQSTPVGAADLRAGDLVFWADGDDPSSIYHVALYVGDGQIIHAPRTGRPVTEESLDYWIAPSFYARP